MIILCFIIDMDTYIHICIIGVISNIIFYSKFLWWDIVMVCKFYGGKGIQVSILWR